jgi:hypothetical protein
MRASSLGLLALLVSCSGNDPAGSGSGGTGSPGGAGGTAAAAGAGGANPLQGGGTAGGGGRGGAGGTAASAGGSSGSSGSSGSTDAAPGLVQLPSCLRDLYAGCPATGACQAQKTDAGAPERICFTSGVKILYSGEQGCTDRGAMTLVQVRKASAAPCYTLEIAVSPRASGCEQSMYTWRNPLGHIVASGTLQGAMLSVQCATDGAQFSCMGSGCPPEWFPQALPACTAGTCQ